jgi:hypothetical protein
MKTSSEVDNHAMLKNLVFASIISADNDELSEDCKQEIIFRYNQFKDTKPWHYILYPMLDDGIETYKFNKYIRILGS